MQNAFILCRNFIFVSYNITLQSQTTTQKVFNENEIIKQAKIAHESVNMPAKINILISSMRANFTAVGPIWSDGTATGKNKLNLK